MKIKTETCKQMAALIFGAVAVAAYLMTVLLPSQSAPTQTVSAPGEGDLVQVVLLDSDATLIPYTLTIESGLDTVARIRKVLDWMTIGHEPVQGARGLLPSAVRLEQCSLSSGQLSLSFSEEFRYYDPKLEMRLLEGITWAVTQFEEVEAVLLYIGDELLTHMPQLATPVPVPLNRQIGINNFENTVSHLHDSDSLTVFYTRQKQGQTLYVPKTLRVSRNLTLLETVERILADLSVLSQLNQPLAASPLQILACYQQEEMLVLDLSGEILDEEKKVNEPLVTSLLLSLNSSLGFEKVLLKVDGVTVNLNGVNDDPIDITSLNPNQVFL